MLLRKIPKPAKRSSRWRSQAHLNHVRSHACVYCGTTAPIEAAHVRIGSGAGIGQKPDDWRCVPLCRDCHAQQHRFGEPNFWCDYEGLHGHTVEDVIAELIKTSPKRADIEREQKERNSG